jgi:hypothetical protein
VDNGYDQWDFDWAFERQIIKLLRTHDSLRRVGPDSRFERLPR